MQQEQKELLQALYEEYESGLRWMAFKRNIPECEVDDMVQETFWKFIFSFHQWVELRSPGLVVCEIQPILNVLLAHNNFT